MTLYPLPRHVVEAKGKEWTKPEIRVRNGAFHSGGMGTQ